MGDAIIIFMAEYLIYGLMLFAGVLAIIEIIKSEPAQRLKKIVFVGLALATAFLLGQGAHMISTDEVRPYEVQNVENGAAVTPLIEHSDDPHFPSDHTLLAFALAFMLLFMTRFRKLAIVALVLAAAVAAGRLLALVHWPLDIVGGVAFAGIGALWYLLYYKKFRTINPTAKEAK